MSNVPPPETEPVANEPTEEQLAEESRKQRVLSWALTTIEMAAATNDPDILEAEKLALKHVDVRVLVSMLNQLQRQQQSSSPMGHAEAAIEAQKAQQQQIQRQIEELQNRRLETAKESIQQRHELTQQIIEMARSMQNGPKPNPKPGTAN